MLQSALRLHCNIVAQLDVAHRFLVIERESLGDSLEQVLRVIEVRESEDRWEACNAPVGEENSSLFHKFKVLEET